MRFATLALLSCTGCSQLLGLDEPVRVADPDIDAPLAADASNLVDAPITDANNATLVRQIIVSSLKVTGGPHTDFPVLISTTQPWLRTTTSGGDVASSNGFDIYFSSDQNGTNRLAHEVELWNGNSGALAAWVKIPSLTTTTTFYIHYGDETITTSQENRPAVWSAGYEMVLHQTATTDSTAKNTVTPTNVNSAIGMVASAGSFNGTTSGIAAGSATAIDDIFTGGGALEAWIRASSFGEGSFGRIMEKNNAAGWLWMVDDINAPSVLSFQTTANTNGRWRSPAGAIALNQWLHVAVVYDKNSTPQMYINGAALTVTTLTGPVGAIDSDATSVLVVGNSTGADRTFDGLLDEVRVSSVSRNAGWFATQYQNQNNPSSFYTIGSPL